MRFSIKILFFLLSTGILAQNTENCDRSLREQWVTATNGERFRDHPALELRGDILSFSTRTFSFIATAQQFLNRTEPVISKPTPILIEDYKGEISIRSQEKRGIKVFVILPVNM